jgi:hypothetical protein
MYELTYQNFAVKLFFSFNFGLYLLFLPGILANLGHLARRAD